MVWPVSNCGFEKNSPLFWDRRHPFSTLIRKGTARESVYGTTVWPKPSAWNKFDQLKLSLSCILITIKNGSYEFFVNLVEARPFNSLLFRSSIVARHSYTQSHTLYWPSTTPLPLRPLLPHPLQKQPHILNNRACDPQLLHSHRQRTLRVRWRCHLPYDLLFTAVRAVRLTNLQDTFMVIEMDPPYRDMVLDLGTNGCERYSELTAILYQRRKELGRVIDVTFAKNIKYNNSRLRDNPGVDILLNFEPHPKPTPGCKFKGPNKSVAVVYYDPTYDPRP